MYFCCVIKKHLKTNNMKTITFGAEKLEVLTSKFLIHFFNYIAASDKITAQRITIDMVKAREVDSLNERVEIMVGLIDDKTKYLIVCSCAKDMSCSSTETSVATEMQVAKAQMFERIIKTEIELMSLRETLGRKNKDASYEGNNDVKRLVNKIDGMLGVAVFAGVNTSEFDWIYQL